MSDLRATYFPDGFFMGTDAYRGVVIKDGSVVATTPRVYLSQDEAIRAATELRHIGSLPVELQERWLHAELDKRVRRMNRRRRETTTHIPLRDFHRNLDKASDMTDKWREAVRKVAQAWGE